MTVGNRTTDLRYADADGAAKSLGKFFSKNWSGGDSPALAKAKKIQKESFPGFWHEYKAENATYLTQGLVYTKRGRLNPESVDRLLMRHRFLYDEYQKKMAYHLKCKEDLLALKKQSAMRALDVHPYNCTIVQSNDVPCSWRQKLSVWGRWHNNVSASAVFGNIVGPKPCWNSNEDNALIEKIRSKLNGVPGFHAGVMIAELERTIKFFGNTSKVLVEFGRRTKSGHAGDALRVLYNGGVRRDDTIRWDGIPRSAQIHLGYQFGLKPLLEDVKSAAQMLGWQAGYSKTSRIRVRRTQVSESRSTNPVSMGWTRQERGQIVALLTSAPKAEDFSGLKDLPSILWERQWMSFIVDWWIPVGKALSALQLSNVLQGVFITTRTTRDTRTNYTSGNGSYATYQVLGDASYYRTISVRRTVSYSLIPKLPKLRPIFHPDLDVRLKHTLLSGSLLVVNRHKILKAGKWLLSQKARI